MAPAFFLPQQFSTSEMADLLGVSRQAVKKRADARGWAKAGGLRKGRGGGVVWAVAGLDTESRNDALAEWEKREERRNRPVFTETELQDERLRLDYLAEQFVRKPERVRQRAQRRLSLLLEALELAEGGMGLIQAFQVTAQFHNIHWANLRNWYYGINKKLGVKDLPRDEWIYALVDLYVGRRSSAEWTDQAQDFFFSLYLHKKAPDASECYRRMTEAGDLHGWKYPSQRTVYRLIRQRERHQMDFMRGKDRDFRNVMPPQQRDHTCFSAGQAVNYDGLHLDIWTQFNNGDLIERPVLVVGQDIFSSKAVASKLGKSECTDLYALAIYDTLKDVCTPEHIWTDNTRAAANKLITGNASNRHRFRNNPGDPFGLLQIAGIQHHFTNPNHEMSSPGAKPVERIFGKGGIHQMIRNNPRIRDLGSKSKPVPEALLREVIAEEIARFNAREGRRGKGMRGRSFDQVFAESFTQRHVVKVSPFTLNLFLLNREVVTIQRDGLISINAGRGEEKNSYWSPDSSRHARQRVMAFYDPTDLTKGVYFNHLNGDYIGSAQYRPSTAFIDKDAGTAYAKARGERLKSEKKAARAQAKMDTLELQQYARSITPPEAPQPAGSRTAFGNAEINKMMSDKGKKDYSDLYANRDKKIAAM